MLRLYFDVDQRPGQGRLSYSERERLRKDKILGYKATIDEWVERSGLYLNGMSVATKLMYILPYFRHNYKLDFNGLLPCQRKNPDYVSETSSFYSFRHSLDNMDKEEQEEIKEVLIFCMMLAIDEVLEHRAPDMMFFPEACINPCWFFRRMVRAIADEHRKGKYSELSESSRFGIELFTTFVGNILGGHSSVYTDVAEIILDFEVAALEQIRYSIENNRYNIERYHMNVDELLKKYTLKESVKAAKRKRKKDLIPIEAAEKAEAERIQAEIEEHREYCRAMERLRDARMEAYDRACDRAGGPLPWMF